MERVIDFIQNSPFCPCFFPQPYDSKSDVKFKDSHPQGHKSHVDGQIFCPTLQNAVSENRTSSVGVGVKAGKRKLPQIRA